MTAGAQAAFHTHMPYAKALSMTQGQLFVWAGQTALKFYGRTVVDEDYNGLALDHSEGERIAAAMGHVGSAPASASALARATLGTAHSLHRFSAREDSLCVGFGCMREYSLGRWPKRRTMSGDRG